MADSPHVKIIRTSAVTAGVTDAVLGDETVLREGVRRRLVFQPELVDNPTNANEAVRGYLWYQTKRDSESWATVESVPLTTVKTGENVRIELRAAEVHKLFQCLSALYEHMASTGLSYGTTRLVPVSHAAGLRDLLDRANQLGDTSTVTAALNWLGTRDADELMSILQADDVLTDRLTAAAALTRLRSFVAEAEKELASDDESLWDELITRNTWTIGQLYSSPIIFFKRQAYLGGKSVDNDGGNFADFIFKNQISDNATIVEIKTPAAPLVSTNGKHVCNNSYPCSMEVAGGVQQVLQYLHTLQRSYGTLWRGTPGFTILRPRLLLIIGNLRTVAQNEDHLRSFELFRGSQRDIDIITFDELVEKARTLVTVLTER